MITNTFRNGNSEIIIENAKDIEEAKEKGFPEGIYSRIYIDGKLADSYMDLIKHIIQESKKNPFIMPTDVQLQDLQKEIISLQKKSLQDELQKLKKVYIDLNVPENIINELDKVYAKIDVSSVRVKE
jgi:hypothetical protein